MSTVDDMQRAEALQHIARTVGLASDAPLEAIAVEVEGVMMRLKTQEGAISRLGAEKRQANAATELAQDRAGAALVEQMQAAAAEHQREHAAQADRIAAVKASAAEGWRIVDDLHVMLKTRGEQLAGWRERALAAEAGDAAGGLLPACDGDALLIEAGGVDALRERIVALEAERDEFRGYLGAIVKLFDAGLAEYRQIPELVSNLEAQRVELVAAVKHSDAVCDSARAEVARLQPMALNGARYKRERDAQRRLVRMLRAERAAAQRWLVEEAAAPF